LESLQSDLPRDVERRSPCSLYLVALVPELCSMTGLLNVQSP